MKQGTKKIFWRVGQEITPETFIQADNYINYQHNLIRSLIHHQCYGLLPAGNDAATPSLTVKAHPEGATVYIENIRCLGITKEGYLIDYDDNNKQQNSVSIAGLPPDFYYVVIRIKPFEQQLIEPVENEETPFSQPACRFDVKKLAQITSDELSILKVNCKKEYPEIEKNYIPPCMSILSCKILLDYYKNCIPVVQDIKSFLYAKKQQYHSAIYPVSMLLYELENLPLSESPYALVQLLKRLLKSFTLLVCDTPLKIEKTLATPYNHDDVEEILQSLMLCLQEIREFVASEKVDEEEDFTPRI